MRIKLQFYYQAVFHSKGIQWVWGTNSRPGKFRSITRPRLVKPCLIDPDLYTGARSGWNKKRTHISFVDLLFKFLLLRLGVDGKHLNWNWRVHTFGHILYLLSQLNKIILAPTIHSLIQLLSNKKLWKMRQNDGCISHKVTIPVIVF